MKSLVDKLKTYYSIREKSLSFTRFDDSNHLHYNMMKFLTNSSLLEGIGSGRIGDTQHILQTKICKSKDDVHILDYFTSLKYLYDKVHEPNKNERPDLLSSVLLTSDEEEFKHVHKLLDPLGGEYSTNPRYTTRPKTNERYDYCSPNRIETMMTNFFAVLGDKIYEVSENKPILFYQDFTANIIEKIIDISAFILYEICTIHPFGDGNGRIARLYCCVALQSLYTPLIDLSFNRELFLNAIVESQNKKNYKLLVPYIVGLLEQDIDLYITEYNKSIIPLNISINIPRWFTEKQRVERIKKYIHTLKSIDSADKAMIIEMFVSENRNEYFIEKENTNITIT